MLTPKIEGIFCKGRVEQILSSLDTDDETPLSEKMDQFDGIWENKTREYDNKLFTEECEPIIPDNLRLPSQVFLCLITESLIDTIVEQTNLYGQQS